MHTEPEPVEVAPSEPLAPPNGSESEEEHDAPSSAKAKRDEKRRVCIAAPSSKPGPRRRHDEGDAVAQGWREAAVGGRFESIRGCDARERARGSAIARARARPIR